MILQRSLAIASLLWVLNSAAYAQDGLLPKGWEHIEPSTLWPDVDHSWRSDFPGNSTQVKGDFNCDKIEDSAELLISTDRQQIGLFVTLALGGAAPQKLTYTKFGSYSSEYLGIEAVEPGKYEASCGEVGPEGDMRSCQSNVIRLSCTGISQFYFAANNPKTYYYWSPKRKKFIHKAITYWE